jgi:peptidoglycan/LPS O-acetylase OafA/YrhL
LSTSPASLTPDNRVNAKLQLGFIDLLKAGAAQFIVLHHLAFYGPMAVQVGTVAPGIIDWLYSYARIAVQVFLVVAGFLAAKSLCPHGAPGIAHPLAAIGRRYLKLVPPFTVALLLAIAASAVARLWMTDESASPPPHLLQFLAHALLLHGIFGFESISAGAWYVAIDFQLYLGLVALLWLAGRFGGARERLWFMPLLVIAGVAASLLVFNRDAAWDAWALYFFGSYGLGIQAWWASDSAQRPAVRALLIAAILLVAGMALALDFRSRIALALVTACTLIVLGRARLPVSDRGLALIRRCGQISYSIFLVHFPVCLIVNAVFTRFVSPQPLFQAVGMLAGWAASVAAGAAFHHWVERPLNRLVQPADGRLRRTAQGAGSSAQKGNPSPVILDRPDSGVAP